VTSALLAALGAGLGGAALVELVAARPRRPAGARGRRGVAVLAGLGRRALGADRGGAGGRVAAGGGARGRLEAAGVHASVEEVAAVRAGAALVAVALVLPLAFAAPGRLGPVLVASGPVAAHLAPLLWLRRRRRRRVAAAERELADVLDLLRVALGAGLAPMRALAEVGRRHPGVLAAELRRTATRRALGVPSQEALAELERRCPAPGVGVLCASLRRAERHGAPLAQALAAQAGQARSRATARTAEAAARASPRIQLIVALLLVPSVLLLVAAALLPALVGR
jgi:tight adherence protein C